MSRFTAHLGLNLLEYANGQPANRDGLAMWWLDDPLPYELGEEGSGKRIVIPRFDRPAFSDADIRAIVSRRLKVRGVTDLGSVPALGRWVVAPSDPAAKGFVLHDDGYVTRGESWAPALGRPATRGEVDLELRIAMKALGTPMWRRAVVHRAVQFGGGRGWGS